MTALFTFLKVLILLPLLFAILFILKYIVKPFIKIHLYKKPGMGTYFFPVLGYLRLWRDGFKKEGDYFALFKKATQLNPDQKLLVTNSVGRRFLLLRDSKYIKEYFHKQHLYNKTGVMIFLHPLMGNGLTSAEGDVWKRHRKIISNSFHYESLKANVPLVLKITREFMDKISPEEYNNFQVIHKIQQITGEVVGQVFLGESLNTYKIEKRPLTLYLADLLSEYVTNCLTPLSLALGPKFVRLNPSNRKIMKKIKNFRQVCLQIVKDRKEQQQDKHHDDLLGSLLKTQSLENPEDRLSDEDIIDEFVTFFIAGMDTTGHMIGMALYNLTQHKEYLEKLKQERDELYNKGVGLTAEKLQKMDILHCFLKETLRFHTPVPIMFNRVAIEDHQLGDLDIPKGMLVKPDFMALMFDEKHFENPYEFNPNRWKEGGEKADPYAYTPFSAGPRNCIGQHLAIMEAKVIISEFLERFEFKLKDGYQLKMVHRFLHEPHDELLFELSPKYNDKQ